MARSDDVKRRSLGVEEAPDTLIDLIFRIVDQPHRARAVGLILLLLLAALVLIAAVVIAALLIIAPPLAVRPGVLGLGWLLWVIKRRIRRAASSRRGGGPRVGN
jgi:hypothetical protein